MRARRTAGVALLGRSALLLGIALVLGCAGQAPEGPGLAESAARQASAEEPGVGGTGHGDDDTGVGGTGLGGDESGVGGTGLGGEGGVGGTGIFGTITALGTVWINGLHVEVVPGTRVTVDGVAASRENLARGQVAWVEAVGTADGGLRARAVAVFHAAVGPLERVGADARTIEILGQRIRVSEEALRVDRESGRSLGPLDTLEPGSWLRVSGLPPVDGDALEATRVERMDAPGEWARILAPAPAAGARRLRVGALEVELAPEAQVGEGPPGRPVALAGRWRAGTRTLTQSRVAEIMRIGPEIERLSFEGYLPERVDSDRLRIHGLVMDASAVAESLTRVRAAEPVWVSARITASRAIRAERILARPVRPEEPPTPPGPRRRDRGPGTKIPPISPDRIERVEPLPRPEPIVRPEPVVRPEPIVRPDAPPRIDRMDSPMPVERPLRLRTRTR